jgi:5-methylcytosine-specific restriction enzyme A
MPDRAARPCLKLGCPGLVRNGRCSLCGPMSSEREYDQARGTAAQRGYGARWQKLRRLYLRRYPVCVLCGRPATDVDHILPRRRGGSDHETNLQALCASCHARKTNQELRQGRGE